MGENDTDTFCYRLTDRQDKAIFVTKLVVLSISLLANAAALITLFYFKGYRRFVFRLVLCLLVASMVGVVVQILEVTPLNHTEAPTVRPGWQAACSAFGFLDQVAVWMSNFVVIWIVGFLCWLMIKPRHKINMFTSKVTVAEAMGINACFFLPFTFNWIPFTREYFGASGHWCWIKLAETTNCSDTNIGEGVAYAFVFYYGPLVVIMLITSVISVFALVVWCKNLVRSDPFKDMVFIVVYPILFNVVGCIVTANRIEEVRRISNGMKPAFSLWVAHAVADPTRTLLPAVFFLLQFLSPTTRKLVMKSGEEPKGEDGTLNRGGRHILYTDEEKQPFVGEEAMTTSHSKL